MIFLDTSAIYAWADRTDANHGAAVGELQRRLAEGEEMLTHSYVLLESHVLLQARLGVEVALKFAEDASRLQVEWVDAELHAAGVAAVRRGRRRRVSLVDEVSFEVMRRQGLTTAFGFDGDFVRAGFRLVP